jgi:hypothetical protein
MTLASERSSERQPRAEQSAEVLEQQSGREPTPTTSAEIAAPSSSQKKGPMRHGHLIEVVRRLSLRASDWLHCLIRETLEGQL